MHGPRGECEYQNRATWIWTAGFSPFPCCHPKKILLFATASPWFKPGPWAPMLMSHGPFTVGEGHTFGTLNFRCLYSITARTARTSRPSESRRPQHQRMFFGSLRFRIRRHGCIVSKLGITQISKPLNFRKWMRIAFQHMHWFQKVAETCIEL